MIRCGHTQKRKRERLVRCATINADNLKEAALYQNDNTLMLNIQDKDCVAIELKYHNACWNRYIRLWQPETIVKPSVANIADVHDSHSVESFPSCNSSIDERHSMAHYVTQT